ncbi:uncharacterized protein LOC108042835 isoform X2 [Drosophila rhopaloa]|uniref:Uncharacterized protein LOC108042835 isoform X2 n=1 Tax=Drosophila rhopaloa TaxID=1041015 RepID=A0A6P4EP44_DRORH|nr:uncharacterized protein LOC108042835 isoform X2 [Drosophila rhopaloa]
MMPSRVKLKCGTDEPPSLRTTDDDDEAHTTSNTASCQHNSNRRLTPPSGSLPLILLLLLLILDSCHSLRLTNGGGSLSKGAAANKEQLNIGLIAPHTNFGKREYLRSINNAVTGLTKTRGAKLTFLKDYSFEQKNIHFDMMSLTPSPTAILSTLCKEFLRVNVSAILYMMNNEQFGHSTASAQYFLQLAGYLGIPVISWNADNSGLERRASQSTLQLQLAPSIEHQSAAMLSILERYKWHQFSVVTSQIAGHDDFVQAVRERVAEMQEHFKFTILNSIVVTRTSDLMELVNSEARVMLLYATQTEAITILRAAEEMKLTGENYVWVVSQSVIEKKDAHSQFPVGMLGVHFDTSSAALMNEISNAIKIYSYGVEAYLTDPANRDRRLTTQSLSCEDEGRGRWDNGEIFFKYLRNVSIEGDLNKPNIEFTADGDLRSAELKIMNLRPSANNKNLVWEEIGVWKSWETQKLDIRDIAWPGNSHAPPQGVPEKFHLKITFLEEAPYINLSPADPVSGKCLMDRGVLCRVAADHEMAADIDVGQAHRNESFYQCCSGFCIDLLEKFAEELGFTYELVRVEDGKWGTLENGKWNGLIADLVNRKTDMVLTSLMINTEREAVVDFSEPFMETGIAIVVAKRTGIISPTAFLEPFDTASWMLVSRDCSLAPLLSPCSAFSRVSVPAPLSLSLSLLALSACPGGHSGHPGGHLHDLPVRVAVAQRLRHEAVPAEHQRDPVPLLPVPHLLAGVGRAVPGRRPCGLAARLHLALHDQRVGPLRRRVPGHIHCQPGRLHDNQGGVPRVQRAQRQSSGAPLLPQALLQVRHHPVQPHGLDHPQVLQRHAQLHAAVQQDQRGRRSGRRAQRQLGLLHLRRHCAGLPGGPGRGLPPHDRGQLVCHDGLRTGIQPQLQVRADVQQTAARVPGERGPGAAAALLDDGHVPAGQAGAQVLGPAGPGAVPLRLPAPDGRHPAGGAAAPAGARLLQVHSQAAGQEGRRPLLRAHLAVHGQVADLPWRRLRGHRDPQEAPLQRPHLRHAPLEGQARAGHVSPACPPAGEGHGQAWHQGAAAEAGLLIGSAEPPSSQGAAAAAGQPEPRRQRPRSIQVVQNGNRRDGDGALKRLWLEVELLLAPDRHPQSSNVFRVTGARVQS